MNNKFTSALFELFSLYSNSENFNLDASTCSKSCGKYDNYRCFLKSIDAVITADEKTFINFNNELVFSFKKFYDMYNIYQLQYKDYISILKIKDDIKKVAGDKLCSVLLVGSHARNAANERSDYDFLVICDDKNKYNKKINDKKIDIISYTTKEFECAVSDEDEFVLWGIKYGLIIYDVDYLKFYFLFKDAKLLKLKKRKKELLERLVYRTSLTIGSRNTSVMYKRIEDLKTQILRSSIIALGSIPKSSPELPEQFEKNINNAELTEGISSVEIKQDFAEPQLVESFETLRKFYFEWLRERL
ncbi:MAG: nucleotidyltransferase domain-containing protein [Acholeplasma sp.]|nr:nucleotidyltransferase domain-containing protein [Acholeplasma sp.]